MFRRALPALFALSLVAAPPRPKLVVVISIDQFSADLLARCAQDLPGGLGRLKREGVWFTDAYQAHGITETGPGHSVLLSGRYPAHTGIPENEWRDAETGHQVYCVEDPRARVVGGDPDAGSMSQTWFRGTTLGDWLQRQRPGSRAFGLSFKDRAAILMSGRHPSAVYWMDGANGFTTSTAYANALPDWLAAFDARTRQAWAGGPIVWAAGDKAAFPARGPEAFTLSGETVRMGLPRKILGVGDALDGKFMDRLKASPYMDELTIQAAEALITNEKLGQGHSTDLLALSLSATDYVAHFYGTFGPEMADQLARLDAALGQFLDFLKTQDPGVWVALSADHGGSDIPERLAEMGYPARRVPLAEWMKTLDQNLRDKWKLDTPALLPGSGADMLYLSAPAIRAAGSQDAAAAQAAEIAKKMDGIADAFPGFQLQQTQVDLRADPATFTLAQRMALSFVPGRSGDVVVAWKPYIGLSGKPPYLEDHGAPWDFDRRVPLIFWGPWKAAQRVEPVALVDLAPTLANELGIKPEEALDGVQLNLGN
ncbi:MAG TPA: alkaline phosphatase family protein [Holophagaceae bacterium]|jgi:predicted AlkP superfamily pyrophosphatase or phosphodiesterase|nr:alkaline phosphatase family protein [Holophagaceae bacterium]